MQNINSFEPLVLRSSVVTHCLPLWVFVYFVSQRLLWFCNILCVRFSFVHIPSFYSQSYCCVLKFPHTLHAFSTRVLVAWRYENVSDRKVWLPWYKVKCLQQTLVSAADTGVLYSTQHVYADVCQVFQNSFTNFFTAQYYYNDKSL